MVEIPNEEMMLYKYTCKSMGLNCPFVATDASLEEVTRKALEHVVDVHKKDFNNIESPEEIQRMSQALERSVRVVMG
jgi:predicted small metal-binding protein